MPNPRCTIITVDKSEELGIAVAHGFTQAGCDVRMVSPESEFDLVDCDLALVYGPMRSMALTVLRLTELPGHQPPIIVWFTEQVPRPGIPNALIDRSARIRYHLESAVLHRPLSRWISRSTTASAVLSKGGRLRAVGEMLALMDHGLLTRICTFTQTNSAFMQGHGLPAVTIPMGYHEIFGERLDVPRDLDVVFLGSTRDQRRAHLIATLRNTLPKRGITFAVRDGSAENGVVFGRDRSVLLNRAKIMLNIMRQPWDDPVFRLLLAAPNGSMLLSETVLPTSCGPFRPNEHFAMSNVRDLADAIEHYVARDDERRRISESAYAYVTSEVTMANMARLVVQSVGIDAG
jgi:hypothetical protein